MALFPPTHASRAQTAPADPRITFTKSFKGGSPEYVVLTVDANGKGTYDSHKLGESPAPRPMQISAATTAQIFSLAKSLKYFRSINLESRLKVAYVGMKTLTYESGGDANKVQFNFTENHAARDLTDILEGISNVEERINELQYAMRYDRLNLPQTLRQIQEGMSDHQFAEPALMIPTLEKISADSRYMHLAQSRALEIMQRIQQGK